MRTELAIKEKREELQRYWQKNFDRKKRTRKGELHNELPKDGVKVMHDYYASLADMYLNQMAILEWVLD